MYLVTFMNLLISSKRLFFIANLCKPLCHLQTGAFLFFFFFFARHLFLFLVLFLSLEKTSNALLKSSGESTAFSELISLVFFKFLKARA